MTVTNSIENEVYAVLDTVKDPEIDTVSVLDLGMIEKVEVEGSTVKLDVLPTFSGCPALQIIRNNIEKAVLTVAGVENVEVTFIYSPPWTSDRITEKGRSGLLAFGIAPPPEFKEDGTWNVDCPYCGSTYVTMDNIFGPTACRSILYCKSCKQPFEAMKPVSTLM